MRIELCSSEGQMGCTPAEKRSRCRYYSVPLFLFRCFLLVFPLFIPCVSLAVPPTVAITSPATGLTNDNTPLLAYTVSDGAVVVKVDNTIVSKVSGNSLDLLSDGTHLVRVEATNAEGTGSAEVAFTVDTTPPGKVAVSRVAAGNFHTIVLKKDGTLWAWGYNVHGQLGLGDGDMVNRNAPARVNRPGEQDSKWAAVAAGGYHTLALDPDGNLWAWGYNLNGAVGDNTNVSKSAPVAVGQGTAWTSIAAGAHHSLALDDSGNLWTWGFNSQGQLGHGSYLNEYQPRKVAAHASWVLAEAGVEHTAGIKSDGSLWTWGNNGRGQLGDGTTAPRTVPGKVELPQDTWAAVSAGFFHTAVMSYEDGLWTFGSNDYGQIGNGSTADQLTMHRVNVDLSGSKPLNGTMAGIAINYGAPLTNNPSVVLTLKAVDASGVSHMQVSNDGTNWSAPEPYATTKTWTLSSGDGTKTVYAKFMDNAGNWSEAISDTIVLDATPPVVTITSPTGVTTRDNTPLLTYTASDAASGVAAVVVKVDGNVVSKVSGNSLDTLSDGPHLVRVEATDAAGNPGSAEVTFTVDSTMTLAFVGTVSASSHTIDTSASGYSTIFYTINGPATVTLRIVKEQQPANTIYQASQSIEAAGGGSFTWEGKTNAGAVVPDEAYLYILEATDGAQTAPPYSPAPPSGTGTVSSCTQEDIYNPYTNDPLTVSYSLPQTARVAVDMFLPGDGRYVRVLDSAPRVPGSYTFEWDGRDSSGTILPVGGRATCAIASLIRDNHIITSGDAPQIASVKTDPYELHLSYGQATKITYTLSRDSTVTVRLISPSGPAITLISSQPQAAGPHTLVDENTPVSLVDGTDNTGKKFVIAEEGDYAVEVRAVSPATGSPSTVRGNVKIEN